MKNFKLKRLLGLAIVGGLAALHSSVAFSAAGDDITNTATLTYDVGGVATDVISNETTFKEDRLLNFTVITTDVASVPVAASATGQITTFRVTNTGNGAQDFSLASFNAAIGVDDPFVAGGDLDSFDVTVTSILVNSAFDSGDGFDAGDTATFIDELPAGSFVDVYVRSTIPTPPPVLANGSLSVVSLQAQIAVGDVPAAQGADIVTDDFGNPDTTAEELVFLDAAGTVAGDGVNDGLDSDNSAYIISAAILSVTKSSVALWDPVNLNLNPKMIPGAYVQFTLVVANDVTATASGDLTTLVDSLVANLALDVDFITNAGPGNPTSGTPGDSIEIDTIGTGRTPKGVTYCTADAADGNGDGCAGVAGAAGSATVNFATLTATAVEGVLYTAGELKPDETITIKFNAIVQ